MFGLSKQERIDTLQQELIKKKAEASHFYAMKESAEENAFYALKELATKNGTTAKQAASTKEGLIILSEVVLNRQWAFFLNEQAMQIQMKLYELKSPAYGKDFHDKELWFDNVIKPAGFQIVRDEMNSICGQLIADVDRHLSD